MAGYGHNDMIHELIYDLVFVLAVSCCWFRIWDVVEPKGCFWWESKVNIIELIINELYTFQLSV